MISKINVATKERNEFVDITVKIRKLVLDSGINSGVCHVFVPHTTAGITINEGADPSVKGDIIAVLKNAVPEKGDYRHAEGNSDAHIKTMLTGNSAQIIIENGELLLGTWQALFLCEYDGPRNRQVIVKIM
jgi:secondary thiamine-phosphate synthase enzyme